MDLDIFPWILEFLLRNSVPDSLLRKILDSLPLSRIDSRLWKTLSLRSIQSEMATASFTEESLQSLEVIEEIDRLDGIATTQAMKEAYCAIAVECCVRYIDACPEKNTRGLFDDAMNRIWKGRIRLMVEAMGLGKTSNLFTAELVRWKDVLESARWDVEVCGRLMNMNTRENAVDKVRVYLKESWDSMGPSFLELADTLISKGDKVGDVQVAASVPNEGCDKGVSESVLVFDEVNMCRGRSHCLTNTTKEGLVVSDGGALCNDAICKEKGPVAGGNQDREKLGKRLLPQRINGAIQKGKLPLEHNRAVPSTRRGVKIVDAEEVGPATMCSKDHSPSNIQVEKLRRSLMSSSLELRALVKDPLPDALYKSGIVRSELASKGVNHEPPSGNQSTVVNVPEQNTCRSMVLYQPFNDILKKQSSASCSNVQRPNLMERNSTAHTYEWDDPFSDWPGGSPKKRRKKGRWSSEEEDALRDGVKKFGKGNWKAILRFHSEIFAKAGRTEVDLKDKWRNLTR